MFPRGISIATLIVLEVIYGLPVEVKIEPVELFHICISPTDDDIKPEKSAVVLLHGLFATHKSYDGLNQVIANRTKRRVCSVDLRNHGDSPWNNRTDIAAFAADLHNFLKTQNIKKVNIIGESLGGKVAIHYALNNPHQVDSIIVEDMRTNSLPQLAILAVKSAGRAIKRIVETLSKGMDEYQAKKYAEEQVKSAAKQFEYYQKIPDHVSKFIDLKLVNGTWQLKHNMNVFYKNINNVKGIWTKSTGLYTGPALFIYGTESVFRVEEDTDNILKLFPNAKLMPIKGLGHLVHQNMPEFDDIAINFLNEIN